MIAADASASDLSQGRRRVSDLAQAHAIDGVIGVFAEYQSGSRPGRENVLHEVRPVDPVPDVLKGKNVLVVDEVDDSRVTMEFCLNELLKEDFGTVGVAVLHEKIKAKVGKIPEGVPYFSGITVEDWWINYPWDALDIDEHNKLAAQNQ